MGSAEVAQVERAPDGSVTRYLGKAGGFVETSNGVSGFALRGEYETDYASPFPGTEADHKERVRAYFVAGGLPSEQIAARVDSGTHMMEWGRVNVEERNVKLLGRTAILRRVVEGISVSESFAYARFNGDDVAVSEQVWWPELHESIKDEISRFAAAVGGSAAVAAYRSRLPEFAKASDGGLVIHHALPLAEHWYETVTWDVMVENSPHSFDVDGIEKHLGAPSGAFGAQDLMK